MGATIIGHDSEGGFETPEGYEIKGSYIKEIIYEANISQIAALVNVSTECKQYISYQCKETAFYYDEDPISVVNVWWVSRVGDPMYNWGSVPTGTCTCNLQSDCETGGPCNCIANDNVWRFDDGVLSDKSKLPVIKIHSGDTGDIGEKALFTVGALTCFG
ncbi:contactin-associated protein-like 2 [Amphiura filiformis]|uniref:contactin-associated protein-like 2 n=1 Tax=Amphiura filiformis TaxID=82378 RepID=UPI003B226579